MIRNRKGLEALLVSHGFSADESKDVAELLTHECPWFGGDDEVSEDIGVDMLGDALPPKVSSLIELSRLLAWHNKNARNRDDSDVEVANAAYAALVQTVSRFGVEDGLGSGDFWVVEDSFSGPCATVVTFKPSPFPTGLKEALMEWLSGQSAVKKIALVNRDGDVLFEHARE